MSLSPGPAQEQDAENNDHSAAQRLKLKKIDDGRLRHNMNQAAAKTGHGQLVLAAGDTLEVGGSIGGVARRIIDAWYH